MFRCRGLAPLPGGDAYHRLHCRDATPRATPLVLIRTRCIRIGCRIIVSGLHIRVHMCSKLYGVDQMFIFILGLFAPAGDN